MWKRSMGGIVRHRQTKEPGTDRPSLNHRATSRLYPSRRKSGVGSSSWNPGHWPTSGDRSSEEMSNPDAEAAKLMCERVLMLSFLDMMSAFLYNSNCR